MKGERYIYGGGFPKCSNTSPNFAVPQKKEKIFLSFTFFFSFSEIFFSLESFTLPFSPGQRGGDGFDRSGAAAPALVKKMKE